MTPTEQNEELRRQVEAIFKNPHCESCHDDWDYDSSYKTDSCCSRFMTDSISKVVQLITADRKRVELEAKIDCMKRLPTVTTNFMNGAASVVVLKKQIDTRIAELKAQKEDK